MKTNHTLLVLALFASMLCAKAQTVERTFYIDMIDKKAVNVAFENGILHIVLPKQKEEDGRTVFDIE